MNKFVLFIALLVCSNSCKTGKSTFVFENIIWTADWSPDDKYIAVGGNNDQLKILNADDHSVYKSFKKLNTITKIKWHPDGKHLAITRQGEDPRDPLDNKAEIINIEDGSKVILNIIHARGLGWTNDGEFLAVGDGEGVLRIFSKTGELTSELVTDQKAIIGLDWHPNNNKIVTVGSHIEIINLRSGERTKIIPREIEILMLCVEWHPTGKFFVTGDYGDNILDYPPLLIFWDEKGNEIMSIDKSIAEYRNLKWTTDGEHLATASDKMRVWSKDGELLKKKNIGSLLWGIDWDSKDERVVVTSIDGDVKVFEILN